MRNDEQSSKRDRIEAALLRDHRRQNRDVAQEVGASSDHAGRVRREMERARRIPVYRPTPTRPKYQRARAALLVDSRRSNAAIGALVRCSRSVVEQARADLLRDGLIGRRSRHGYTQAIRTLWPSWRGSRTALARHLGCTPALVSHVMNQMEDEARLQRRLEQVDG